MKSTCRLVPHWFAVAFFAVILVFVAAGCVPISAPSGADAQGAGMKPVGAVAESVSASIAPTARDLAYATGSDAQKLDIYLPLTGDGPFPLVVTIHGGGFMMGDKAEDRELVNVEALLAEGFAVAGINYRLSNEAQWPAQIHDAKAAVRFLRANAQTYNLDPNKFGVWGASAGGNLAAMLGTTCGVAELEGDLGNADQSSCVQAVVDWFGPIDFLKLDEQFAGSSCPQDHNAANSPESRLVGAPVQSVPDVVVTTNPMNFIDPTDPPFLIEHGSADCNIPPVQGSILADALGADRATYVLIDGAGHGTPEFSAPENLKIVLDFLSQQLK